MRARGSGGTPQTAEYYHTHGDLIWRVVGGEALLVGGNLGNTAKVANKIAVDSEGRPISAISGYKVILKKQKKSGLLWWVLGFVGLVGTAAYIQSRA